VSLRATAISVRRGAHPAVRAVDLSVAAGEVVAVLGPSGAGKSSLLDALAGQLVHTGTVEISGRDVSREPPWRRARAGLGYVPQGPSVLFDLTVDDNLRTFARIARTSPDLAALVIEVGLGGRSHVVASALSGGERRRLELARAFLAEPRVLLCDEPLTGLAPRDLPVIAGLLRARADRGAAVIVSDHHVAEALAIADRAILLVDGAIAAEAPAARFLDHPGVVARYATR
jgi:ABC-type multidrug transport system ATPase subunit